MPEDMLHKENSWEYYFEQPMFYTLADITKSKRIVKSIENQFLPKAQSPLDFDAMFSCSANFLYIKNMFKTFIKFNNETTNYFAADMNRCLQGKDKVLGVLMRGTDYIHSKPKGHAIQPDVAVVIKKAEWVISEYKCTHIYLATEDSDIYAQFTEYFGEIVFSNDQVRYSAKDFTNDVQWNFQLAETTNYSKRDMGLQYLSSMNILSKCNCFIGGKCGGIIATYLMTEGFEYDYIWDLGVY
jgi:hypothetical protein